MAAKMFNDHYFIQLFKLYSFFYILYAFIYWILKHSTLEIYWIVFKEVYFHVLVGFYDCLATKPIITHHMVFGAVLVRFSLHSLKELLYEFME